MVSRRSFLQSASMAGLALGSTPSIFAEQENPLLLKTFDYKDVALAPGLAQTQFEETQAVLLSLNDDSLLKPWRLRAGLPAPGPDMGGWYDQVTLNKTDSGGHGFAPAHSTGQWISALSRGYAITGDPATRAKILKLLDMYEPAISGKFYTNFRFPAYNYDKWVIGLIDAHRYANVPQALSLLDRTTNAAEPHLPSTALDRDDPQKRWRAQVGENTANEYLWDESYTMPENLYIASQQGGGERYRKMAARYLLDKTYFEPLSENKNVLPNHHAYSFCNALSSAMQAYIVGGSKMHLKAASNAFDMISATQSFATGGWGPNESFVEPGTGALYKSLTETHRGFETPCGSYAHFKLTRYLLQITGDGRYGDSMERVLYNTVLGAKPLERDGHAFYYSDYNVNASRTYFPDAWPCCSGTLPQLAADYRILTYFHDAGGVFVNLYMPSTVKWTSTDGTLISLTQSGNYPLDGNIAFRLKLSRPSEFAVRLRIPAWSEKGGATVIRVNGSRVTAPMQSGFAVLRRKWTNSDRIELDIPLPIRLEAIDSQHPDMVALVRGPLVLFAITKETPRVTRNQLLAASRIPGRDTWTAQTSSGTLQLLPFTAIGDSGYRTYLEVS